MKRVSVLFALTSPVRGGIEEVVLALARRLDPREFRLALTAPAPLLEAFASDLGAAPPRLGFDGQRLHGRALQVGRAGLDDRERHDLGARRRGSDDECG